MEPQRLDQERDEREQKLSQNNDSRVDGNNAACSEKDSSGQESENTGDSERQDMEQQFEVIGGPSCNQQLLLIKGVPGQMYQLNGKVLCSNRSLYDGIGDQFLDFLSMGLRKIEQRELGYSIVRKRAPNTGKVLILDSEVYDTKFYIDQSYILLLNLDKSEYKLKTHANFRHLKLISVENPQFTQLVVLQGKKGKPILEKSLAEDEEMFIPNAHIVAMSDKVFVRKNKKTNQLRLRGPGIVFVEAVSKFSLNPKVKNFILTNLLMIIFLAIIVGIEMIILQ